MNLEMFLFFFRSNQPLPLASKLRIQPYRSKSFVNRPFYTPVCKMDFMCD